MLAKDFPVFCTLLADVHAKAFGETLAPLTHGKAQSLSWFIYETTGNLLSYKTLGNYIQAILDETPERINPNTSTLAILIHYAHGQAGSLSPAVMWYQFRSKVLHAA